MKITGGILPRIDCAVLVWLLTAITPTEWTALAVVLAAAGLVYGLTRARRIARLPG